MKKVISILLCAVMLLVSCGINDKLPVSYPEASDTDTIPSSEESTPHESTPPESTPHESTPPESITEPETEPEVPPVEPRKTELIPSPEPMRYYSGHKYCMSVPEDGYTDYWYSGIIVTIELVEVLPDTYTCFYNWDQCEVRMLKVKTMNNLGSGDVAEEFYLFIPSEYFTDFTVYKTFVLPRAVQLSMDNSVWYNKTLGCAERLDLPVYGASEYLYLLSYNDIMAFDENGFFDLDLWYSTDAWVEDTERGMNFYKKYYNDKYIKMTEGTYSLAEAEESVGNLENKVSTVTLNSYSGEAREMLEYAVNTENGIFVDAGLTSTDKTRYINGYPTNEWVSGYVGYPSRSKIVFTDEDVENAPDLASALKAIGEDYATGKIRPPHIKLSIPSPYSGHALFGSYYKNEDGVYGIISLTWRYSYNYLENNGYLDEYALKNLDDDLIDHRYYIIRPGSNVYEEITSDEYHDLMNSEDVAEYDKYGLIYPEREVYKPNKN